MPACITLLAKYNRYTSMLNNTIQHSTVKLCMNNFIAFDSDMDPAEIFGPGELCSKFGAK